MWLNPFRKWRTFVTGALFFLAISLLPLTLRAIEIQKVSGVNGIEAWLFEEHSIPMISMSFAFQAGAASDPDDRQGAARMLSVLLDEGAGDLDASAFQTRLEELAIMMSFGAGQDHFTGSMKTLTRNEDEAFRLLALALNKPRFDEDAVERMRAALLAQLRRTQEDPMYTAMWNWDRNAFGDHPYARRIMGTAESLAALKPDDLRATHQRIFTRDRLKIAVVGDIDAVRLQGFLERLFADLPLSGSSNELSSAPLNAGPWRRIVRMDIPQTVVMFGHAGIARADPDFFPAYVLNEILGGGPLTSRLYKEVRERRGLAYSIMTGFHLLDHAPLFIGSFATRNDRVKNAIALVEEELKRMVREGPTEDELSAAKSYLTGSYALDFDTNGKIAHVLLDIQLDGLGADYIDERNDFIEAVTIDQVKRVASRLLQPDRLMTIVVGAPTGVEEILPGP